jgi:hypothetical protein
VDQLAAHHSGLVGYSLPGHGLPHLWILLGHQLSVLEGDKKGRTGAMMLCDLGIRVDEHLQLQL